MFIFALPALWFSLLIAFGAVVNALGGAKTIIMGLALERAMKSRGYHPSEGIFTERVGGVDGLLIAADNDNPIAALLVEFSSVDKRIQHFIGRRMELTEGEGDQLQAILLPAFTTYKAIAQLSEKSDGLRTEAEKLRAGEATEEAVGRMKEIRREVTHISKTLTEENARLAENIEPIVLFLERFPAARIR